MNRPPLSVLDLSPVPAGGTAGDALRGSIALARAAERAGYHRYWVAEHHLVTGVASSSTPVLVAMIADATSTIRVGSGAVQLPITRPVQAAEQFGTVAQVHPGRIDLGLGRFDLHRILRPRKRSGPPRVHESRVVDGLLLAAPARVFQGDPWIYGCLAEMIDVDLDAPAPDYGTQVDQILSYLAGTATSPDGRPLHVTPAEGAELDVAVLGSTPGVSAEVAGSRGLTFAVAHHLLPFTVLSTVEAYRKAFRPGRIAEPHVIVSADVVVAETDERARELAAPYAEWVLGIRTGKGAQPYVTPAEARSREWTDEERAGVRDRTETQFVGSPATVAERLDTLARVTGADELMVTTITTDPADRVRSHELLAAEWGLTPRPDSYG
ncbi:LLM class flavin-dependent oxidoreductase [Pseudonocardia ailaonensis]|uniref:LLM class flavin-dependent oxidoreductase n=1 Tax=Pseudonocardia ailaonensis TaxID=367279 RepID=A0ABN2MRU6_9PSEU